MFTSEQAAIRAIKGQTLPPVKANDVVVLIGVGPLGTGMEETYQLTSALKYIPWGKTVPILTDARFSGVSTGACIGHIGPEALAGGPLGKVRDGDQIRANHVLAATILACAYRQQNDEESLAGQLESLGALIANFETALPQYEE